MKKLILITAFLLSGLTYSQTFDVNKDNLKSVQEKFLSVQKDCRKMEAELAQDPFLKDLDAQMEEGVNSGELSQEVAGRVKTMVGLVVKLQEELCSHIDGAVSQIEKDMKSEEGVSAFSLVATEKAMFKSAESILHEIIELAVAPELSEEEQGLLKVIGDVMQRAADKIAQEQVTRPTQN